MSSQPVHTIAKQTLRHWTIDSVGFVKGTLQAASASPCSKPSDGDQFHRLASTLARLKIALARQAG